MLSNTILLGGRSDAEDLDSLKRLGVTHILNVAVQCSNCFPQSFVYMKIPMLGEELPHCMRLMYYRAMLTQSVVVATIPLFRFSTRGRHH